MVCVGSSCNLLRLLSDIVELTQFPRTAKSHGQYHEPRSADSGIHCSVSSGVQLKDDDGSVRAMIVKLHSCSSGNQGWQINKSEEAEFTYRTK